jgi:hypothetical protein
MSKVMKIETIYRTEDGQVWDTEEEAIVHVADAALREEVGLTVDTEEWDVKLLAVALVGGGGWPLVRALIRSLNARGIKEEEVL